MSERLTPEEARRRFDMRIDQKLQQGFTLTQLTEEPLEALLYQRLSLPAGRRGPNGRPYETRYYRCRLWLDETGEPVWKVEQCTRAELLAAMTAPRPAP